jgi:transcription elongation factor Elf1
MTAVLCSVDWCDRPVLDQAYSCQRCADRLSVALGDVTALWGELDTVLTRQARYSDAEGRGCSEKALPFNANASEIGWVLRNTLSTWCRIIAEERGRVLPTADNPPTVAGWLLHHVEWLRHHRAGAEAIEEITSAVHAVRKAVDRPAERIYAGPCADCGGDMYGKPDAASVECRPCGLSYDVAEMRDWMRAQVYGRLVTAREGVVLLSRFGLPVSQKTVEKWHLRKRVGDHGHDPAGKRLYLFDDLVTLAASTSSEKAS